MSGEEQKLEEAAKAALESEDIPNVNGDEGDEGGDEGDPPEVDPREADARKSGWVPKEEWKGPADKWRDLDTFLDVGERINRSHKELRSQLSKQQMQNAELQKAVQSLITGQDAIRKAERERTVLELKDARKQAISDGDVDQVEALDQQIEQQKNEEVAAKKTPPAENKASPELESWLSENQWYIQHPAARAMAQALDSSFAQQGMDVPSSLVQIRNEVEKRFPELFEGSKAPPAPRKKSPVEGGGRRRSGKATAVSDLPAEVQAIAKELDRQGVMPLDRYIKEYNKGVAS